jgi:hypothetical protein
MSNGGTLVAKQQVRSLRSVEGRQVSVTLRDGTCIGECHLVSSGRNRVATLWLFTNGEDIFVPYCDVAAVREARGDRRGAA